MLKIIYDLDAKGFVKERYVAEVDDEGAVLDTRFSGMISQDMPNGLLKPRWTGTEWVEGETEEEKAEREAKQLLESLKPTPEEVANAELEIKMLTMLTDLGVVQ